MRVERLYFYRFSFNKLIFISFSEPSEENINLLMEMGFTRERVVQALRETNNDVQLATVILLQQ